MNSVELYRSSAHEGYSARISENPRRVFARKLVREVQVTFAPANCTVQTREGIVHVRAGDAIVTGVAGERWRVSQARFREKYLPVPPTVAGTSGRYTSRPIKIIAVPMDEAFEVLLSDGVSLLHGQCNDWLVDYGDGSLGVVSPAIFATTYEITG